MNLMTGVFLIACVASAGCRDAELALSNDASRIYPSDEEVMAKAYDSMYGAPDGFLVDDRASTTRSYTVYHVKDASDSYELCTNDFDEALAWESADNKNRAVNGVYVGAIENDRYFEFIRELAYPGGVGNIADTTSPGFSRVFKCDYVSRNGVDRNIRDGYAGLLNRQPLNGTALSGFVEYMWQFTFFWPAKKTVLDTFSEEQANRIKHTLMLAFVSSQGTERCDLIEVVDWVFEVEKGSGKMTKSFDLLYQFKARLVNGVPEKCG